MDNLVSIAEGRPITTSLLVAERFGKLHKDVLRATKEIVHSAQNCAQFYQSSTYTDSTGRKLPMYYMDREYYERKIAG